MARGDFVQCLHFGSTEFSLTSLMKIYEKRRIAAAAAGLEDEHVVDPALSFLLLVAVHNKHTV